MQKAIELLHFHPRWFEFKFLPDEFFSQQIERFKHRYGDDHLVWQSLEHHRYLAFYTILSTYESFTDEQVTQYIELCTLDEDETMAHSALINLLQWGGLTDEQYQNLIQHSAFADAHSQKMIWRNFAYEAIANGEVTDELFDEILQRQDSAVQRELVSYADLTQYQLETLAEQGSGRAIRNIAKQRLQRTRGVSDG